MLFILEFFFFLSLIDLWFFFFYLLRDFPCKIRCHCLFFPHTTLSFISSYWYHVLLEHVYWMDEIWVEIGVIIFWIFLNNFLFNLIKISRSNWKYIKDEFFLINLCWRVLKYLHVTFIYKLLGEHWCIHANLWFLFIVEKLLKRKI